MNRIKHIKLSEKERTIDNEVIKEANNEGNWEKSIHVSPHLNATSIRLSSNTIERAKFFAKVHSERGYQTWLKKIIEERIDTEYKLYQQLKQKVA
jgi:hypothetical protein